MGDSAITLDLIVTLIGIFGTVCAIIAFFVTRRRNDRSDSERSGQLLSDIGYIKASVDEIKAKQDKQDEKYTDLSKAVTRLEEEVKHLHDRMDILERDK